MLMTIAVNKNDQLVSIKQVERGLKCDCFCFECGEPVVAKKGEKMNIISLMVVTKKAVILTQKAFYINLPSKSLWKKNV